MKFGIRNIPALLFFNKGEIVDKQIGAVPKSVLACKLDKQIAYQFGPAISSLYFLLIRHCYINGAQQTQQKTHEKGFDAALL